MAADDSALGALHEAVASVLIEVMRGKVIPGYTDEDGTEHPETIIPPSAAEIQAATKFLKDNNITCTPAKDNTLGELEQVMKDRMAKRRASRADLRDATEQAGFLTGLPN